MQTKLERALRKAIRFLNSKKVPYALIGGLAVSHWGFDRYTEDVDFKVFVPDSDFPSMRALLRSTFPIDARPNLPSNSPVVAVRIEGVAVDFAMSYPGYDELVVQRAVEAKVKDLKIRFATAEDLIILKMITERSKDKIDIDGLTNIRYRHLDFAYIHDWLKQFDAAIEDAELVATFEKIVANAKRINDKS